MDLAPSRLLLRVALAAALLTAAAHAQSVKRIVPEIGDPGDLIRIEGEGLAQTELVVFTANVGGLVGVDQIEVVPITATDQLVWAFVPEFQTFSKSKSVPPPAFVGNVGLTFEGQALGSALFGFLEVEGGKIRTYGQGGSTIGGPPPQFSVELKAGLPVPGEHFRPKVVDAPPLQVALLRLGLPAASPYPPFGGGQYLLAAGAPNKIATLGIVGFDGTFTAPPLHVPLEAVGLEIAYQWFLLNQALGGGVSVSDGLQIDLAAF